MSVTMRDVAKKAGVSLKTVSRVINNEDNVTPETREWVQKVAGELGYVPNLTARNLSLGKAMAIGHVMGWPLTTTFTSTLAHFIQAECMDNGYSLALFSKNVDLIDQVVQAYLGKQVDGLILETIPGMNVGLREKLDNLQVPYLVVHPGSSYGMDRFSYVTIDDYYGARIAVEYLINLGHTAIGCIIETSEHIQEVGRLSGYRDALMDAGIPFQEMKVYRKGISSFSMGYSGALHLMSNNNDMTAIFCHTDEVAMGAMSAIWQSGHKIPDHISVVGFDDIRFAAMMIPPLTTIHQPIDQIAKVAVEHLIKMIDDPSTERLQKTLPTNLVIRDTCKSLQK